MKRGGIVLEKIKSHMDESILVCVYYGPNGKRLINRGYELASMTGCPFYVLTVDKRPYDEFDEVKSGYIDSWQELSEELGAKKFIVKDNETRSSVKAIKEVAHHYNITQVIIGETPQNRWEEITKGSFVNVLMRELLFTDIHIVSVDRTLKSSGDATYEKGVRGFLKKGPNGYELSFKRSKQNHYEGVFYKEIGTDFNNGIFKFVCQRKTVQVHVKESYVTEKIIEPPNLI